jgi:hypothetical protein
MRGGGSMRLGRWRGSDMSGWLTCVSPNKLLPSRLAASGASIEGEAHQALPGEGATQAP